MNKDEIADTAIKYVELVTLAVQAQHEYRPSPSAKRNSELALDYHEAMAEMARAELQLHAQVWGTRSTTTFLPTKTGTPTSPTTTTSGRTARARHVRSRPPSRLRW